MSRRFIGSASCATSLIALSAIACTGGTSDDADQVPGRAEGQALASVSLPGRLQAEAYRGGGEGVGYHDTTPGNSGGAFRTDDVDIEATQDAGGGHDVGWTEVGEWLAYDVAIGQAGSYAVTLRLASEQTDPKTVHLELDGKPLSGGVATLASGTGWQTWQDVATAHVTLPAGNHVLKLVFDSAKVNVDYLDVKAAPTPPPPSRAPIVMGMYNNTAIAPGAEVSTPESFRVIVDKYFVGSKVKVDRQFDGTLPSSYGTSGGAGDPANGNVSFLSVKPPHDDIAGVAAGKYDTTIRSLAASMPAGAYLTMYHEPEANMTGPQFVAMFRQFYTVAKGANRALTIGYVGGAYQWRPGSSSTADPDTWWPGAAYTDFLGLDSYVSGYEKVARALDTHPSFQRWYTWAKTKGKPCILPEYGIEAETTGGFSDQVRADTIRKSMEWVWTQPQIKLVMWWNGTAATPGGKDHTLNPTTSDPVDRFPLARRAWNDMVTQYGSTATSY